MREQLDGPRPWPPWDPCRSASGSSPRSGSRSCRPGSARSSAPGRSPRSPGRGSAATRRRCSPTSSLPLSWALPRRAPVGGQQAEQRHRRLGLAGAGLADDREHLARVDVVAHVDGGREPLAVDVERDVEVLDLEDRSVVLGDDGLGGPGSPECRESKCSRVAFRCCRCAPLGICEGGPMGSTEVLRSSSARALGVAMMAAGAVALGTAVHRRRGRDAGVRRSLHPVRVPGLGGLLAPPRGGVRRRCDGRQHACARSACPGPPSRRWRVATACACARRTAT